MLLNGIIWIIMQHSRNWSTFTVDGFLTVINLIYKMLFYHQPWWLIGYHLYYQIICKKEIYV